MQTGHGVPTLQAIIDCAYDSARLGIPIIADGGIKNSGDIVKALAAGADFVTIVGGSADELGTSIQVYTDGTYWYMLGLGSTAAMLTATG